MANDIWSNSVPQGCTVYREVRCTTGWRSGESARFPPMWAGSNSRSRRHMWVELVVGSLLVPKELRDEKLSWEIKVKLI